MRIRLTALSVMISRVMIPQDRKFNGFTPLLPKNLSYRAKVVTGFTFIELILVILIIGVLVASTTPNLKRSYSNLHLSSFARDFQSLMNSLHERSIVDGKIIYLNIEDESYWAQVKDVIDTKLMEYKFGPEIKIEAVNKKIAFYPDGSIDKVDIKLSDTYDDSVNLTTKGVFNGVKLQPKE